MILQQLFKTYKKDFPLFAIKPNGEVLCTMPMNVRSDLLKNLILDLSEFTTIPMYCYMSRHYPDKISDTQLLFFKEKYKDFVNRFSQDCSFKIATIWFVPFVETYEEIDTISQKLDTKNIEYYKNGPVENDSIDSIPIDNKYTTTEYEAKTFPKFLHQATQIGIDLLKNPSSLDKLRQLKTLETMRYEDENVKFIEIKEFKDHLRKNSIYYQNNIESNKNEKSEFWLNFQRVYGEHSWPHFLFNICGSH